jgi:glycosyltransferase involved in cell wall biosynthesis
MFPLGTSNFNSFRRIKGLMKYDYKIIIVCPKIKYSQLNNVVNLKNNYNIEVLDVLFLNANTGAKKHLTSIFFNCKQLKNIIENNKLDLIHIVNPPDIVPFIVSALAIKNKIPFIFHIADPGPESMATIFSGVKKHILVLISSIIEKIIINRSNGLITVNNVLREQIVKTRNVSGHDFKVVYNVPERINIQNSNKGRKIKSIVYIGTLSSEMIGIKDFLYNYKKIHNWQETIFNIIGSGPHKNELERICVENNLINQIVFKGHLDYNQAMQIVADSSLALLPYRDTPLTRISLPTKLFEYMNASKVIVCPNLPGIIEILGIQNQGIYDVRINDAIYDKINKLFNSKYLILETEQINYNISKKYNINNEVQKIHELYNTVFNT